MIRIDNNNTTRRETMKIQFPVLKDGTLKMNEYRNDDCLTFYSDGKIESNGGRVDHHEITEDILEVLPESDREKVKRFLLGDYSHGKQ